MIQHLQINNFQSHKDSELNLHPGVNVVVGPSDSGKTAIIRALRWLVWNRPTGDAFRSTWGGNTIVRMLLEEGQVIVRNKDGKENVYSIDGKFLAAFGSGVPDEVVELLNLDESNLQQQLDSPFLISESPGAVASYFNRIAHLDQIDIGLKNAQSAMRKLGYDEEKYTSEQTDVLNRLKQFEYLDKAESDLEVLEGMEQDQLKRYNQKSELESLITQYANNEQQIQTVQPLLILEQDVEQVVKLYEELDALETSKDNLERTAEMLQEIQTDIEFQEELLGVETSVNEILTMYEKMEAVDTQCNDLNTLIERLDATKERLGDTENEIKELEQKFHKNMPEVCPLCGK